MPRPVSRPATALPSASVMALMRLPSKPVTVKTAVPAPSETVTSLTPVGHGHDAVGGDLERGGRVVARGAGGRGADGDQRAGGHLAGGVGHRVPEAVAAAEVGRGLQREHAARIDAVQTLGGAQRPGAAAAAGRAVQQHAGRVEDAGGCVVIGQQVHRLHAPEARRGGAQVVVQRRGGELEGPRAQLRLGDGERGNVVSHGEMLLARKETRSPGISRQSLVLK